MLVFTDNTRWLLKKQRQSAVGSGLFDWVPSMTRTMGTVGSFLAANKDTIKTLLTLSEILQRLVQRPHLPLTVADPEL